MRLIRLTPHCGAPFSQRIPDHGRHASDYNLQSSNHGKILRSYSADCTVTIFSGELYGNKLSRAVEMLTSASSTLKSFSQEGLICKNGSPLSHTDWAVHEYELTGKAFLTVVNTRVRQSLVGLGVSTLGLIIFFFCSFSAPCLLAFVTLIRPNSCAFFHED